MCRTVSVEKSKTVTINSITYNTKGIYADVCKLSKKKDIKEGEIRNIVKQNVQK